MKKIILLLAVALQCCTPAPKSESPEDNIKEVETGLINSVKPHRDQNEFIHGNFYTGVILLERKPRASETFDSAFWKKFEKLGREDPDSAIAILDRSSDSLKKIGEAEEREERMAYAGVEKINIAVSPEAFLQAKDTTGIVLEYSYFFDDRESFDEEQGTYIYIFLPSPEKINQGTNYAIPTEELSVSAWKWGAWMGMVKCNAITGNIVFSGFESDKIMATINISGTYPRGYTDKVWEFHFSEEVEFVKKEN